MTTCSMSFFRKDALLICMLVAPMTVGLPARSASFQTRMLRVSPWLWIASMCLPSGEMRNPVMPGNCAKVSIEGTRMGAGGAL